MVDCQHFLALKFNFFAPLLQWGGLLQDRPCFLYRRNHALCFAIFRFFVLFLLLVPNEICNDQSYHDDHCNESIPGFTKN